MDETVIVELKGVTKVYHQGQVEVHALRGLSLRLEKGEFTGHMFVTGRGYALVGDRSINRTVQDATVPTDSADFAYKASSTFYNFGLGFRLRFETAQLSANGFCLGLEGQRIDRHGCHGGELGLRHRVVEPGQPYTQLHEILSAAARLAGESLILAAGEAPEEDGE